ncbi:bifunctional aminoglycoside phosphotransferase/ATP-binding protein [Paractinoplanes hotanensis]|uniref:AAA family ATPase n=1 Tax=Paractinoplanes hotanensis TaxID=2906497 RepID=A0ABT0YGL7_9ACTN|nr:AAA family ATPase [Actinoplanes hotanensis]MCM4084845.1 AAA family ATPase [Actinoplanes hotanensis]
MVNSLETHAAILFFIEDRVYKMKKPVDLGFLDFRERTDREAVCHREVELNRRLAGDVYLGVADVHGPDGRPCEHLVVMRRMPDDRRLSTLIRSGAPVDEHLRRLARLLAGFHATAAHGPAISAEGTRDALLGRWDATFAQLRPFRGGVLDDADAGEIEERTHRFLAGREPLLTSRVKEERIVDGHADLIADDIFCLDDGPRPLDCLEFDDRLRYVDVLDDAAFLAMDVEHLGAGPQASAFLDQYAEFSGDTAPQPLRHHYIAYRAFVRAKVACLRHRQGDSSAATDVRAYTGLTLRHLRAGTVRLILVGGGPATGKTTLAGGIADRLGAVVLSSDRIRKEMAGLAPGMSAAAGYQHGIYTREWTDRAYRELLLRAEYLLGRGETVILDASWNTERHRTAARDLAAKTHSSLHELLCTADRQTVLERLAHRTGSMSDADAGIAEMMAAAAEPWPEAAEMTGACLERAVALVEPGR